jgi:hypothetical protein
MSAIVLPGDPIQLPTEPVDPSTSQSITFGPGIGASTFRDGSKTISAAMRMGKVNESTKRRRTKDGQMEVTRLWVDVASKRVSHEKSSSRFKGDLLTLACGCTVHTSTGRRCNRDRSPQTRRRVPSRHRCRSISSARSVRL